MEKQLKMPKLKILIQSKILELYDIIESVGKYWQQTKNPQDLDFICRRIEARNRLELYLENSYQ